MSPVAGWLLATLLAAVPAGGATPRETIGIYRGWGAFRDARPARCYAIARPIVAGGRRAGFASVATWPARGEGLRNTLYVRLSQDAGQTSAVTLSVGDRRFRLVGRGADAWATDAPSDRALVAAIRAGRSMSIEATGADGRAFADIYALAGAATAIDAAALACAGRARG